MGGAVRPEIYLGSGLKSWYCLFCTTLLSPPSVGKPGSEAPSGPTGGGQEGGVAVRRPGRRGGPGLRAAADPGPAGPALCPGGRWAAPPPRDGDAGGWQREGALPSPIPKGQLSLSRAFLQLNVPFRSSHMSPSTEAPIFHEGN